MSALRTAPLLALVGLFTLNSCGSSGGLSTVAGTVSVDGKPVESGIIHIKSNASPGSSGGSGVTGGKFQVVSKDGFAPGEYTVVLQAFRKTGRTFKDPQKGEVEETASVALSDSPQTVTLSQDKASNLRLNYTAAKK